MPLNLWTAKLKIDAANDRNYPNGWKKVNLDYFHIKPGRDSGWLTTTMIPLSSIQSLLIFAKPKVRTWKGTREPQAVHHLTRLSAVVIAWHGLPPEWNHRQLTATSTFWVLWSPSTLWEASSCAHGIRKKPDAYTTFRSVSSAIPGVSTSNVVCKLIGIS